MEFSLKAAKVRLLHKNERIEMHGDVEVLACDLDFEHETNNGVLAEFSPVLRSMLYCRPEGEPQELPGVDPDKLTALREPALGGEFKFAGSIDKADLEFSKGKKVSLAFSEVKVSKFLLLCSEGGTVKVRFQARVYPNSEQSGQLSGFLTDKHCLLTIRLPGEEAGSRPTA